MSSSASIGASRAAAAPSFFLGTLTYFALNFVIFIMLSLNFFSVFLLAKNSKGPTGSRTQFLNALVFNTPSVYNGSIVERSRKLVERTAAATAGRAGPNMHIPILTSSYSGNSVADKMAKLAVSASICVTYFEDLPPSIVHVLIDDTVNAVSDTSLDV
ncbi:hypothetical protein V6N13_044604 [Hibiscus sabdariffa]